MCALKAVVNMGGGTSEILPPLMILVFLVKAAPRAAPLGGLGRGRQTCDAAPGHTHALSLSLSLAHTYTHIE